MQITELNLSTRQVKAFLALAQQKNFTRAARECNLSQSAFSTQVRTLEEALGVRLFDRDTRNVELTPEGRLFLDGAQRLMEDLRASLANLGEHAARRRGRVLVAALPSLAAGWMPAVLAGFRSAHPDIELGVADVLSDGCLDLVRSGRADFALAASPPGLPGLQTELFCEDGFHLVCGKAHPLARRRQLALAHIAGEPFIHLARSSSVRQHLEAAIHPLRLNQVMELDQLSTVAGMVRAGLGISIVPTLTLFHFRDPGLATRPLDLLGLRRQIFLVTRSGRSLSIAAQALREHFRAHRPVLPARRGRSRGPGD